MTHTNHTPDVPPPQGADEPVTEWWKGGASSDEIKATSARLLAFITKHAAQTPEELPLLHDVHVLVANAGAADA